MSDRVYLRGENQQYTKGKERNIESKVSFGSACQTVKSGIDWVRTFLILIFHSSRRHFAVLSDYHKDPSVLHLAAYRESPRTQ
jgi:hypothetical protein